MKVHREPLFRTKRVFQLAAEDFKSLGTWISFLTVCSIDYITATKQMYEEAIDVRKIADSDSGEKATDSK